MPGLANAARVTVEECEKAVAILEAPDKYSRTREFEGRRIAKVPDGWFVLNHEKFRDKLSGNKEDMQARERMRMMRERNKSVTLRNPVCVSVSGDVSDPTLKGGCKGETVKTFKQWNVEDLGKAVEAIEGTLDTEQAEAFIDYWTEPMANGKPRMSGEKAWDTKRRMGTWARNNEKQSNRGYSQPKRPVDVKVCRDVAIGQAIDALDHAKESTDEDAVSRCLSVLNDKFRDMGKNRDGQMVATEAYEVWKFQNKG